MNDLRYSVQTILSVSKTTLSNARGVVDTISRFGITTAILDQFEKDITTAEALPGELSNRIELKVLTNDKEETLDECYQWSSDLRLRLDLAHGVKSSQYKLFPSKELNEARSSENKMMTVMETLVKLSKDNVTTLAEYGQSKETITEGQELLTELRKKDAMQELQKSAKTSDTQERYEKFRTLYDTVNRINKVGRKVFKDDLVRTPLFKSPWPKKGTDNTVDPESN